MSSTKSSAARFDYAALLWCDPSTGQIHHWALPMGKGHTKGGPRRGRPYYISSASDMSSSTVRSIVARPLETISYTFSAYEKISCVT